MTSPFAIIGENFGVIGIIIAVIILCGSFRKKVKWQGRTIYLDQIEDNQQYILFYGMYKAQQRRNTVISILVIAAIAAILYFTGLYDQIL